MKRASKWLDELSWCWLTSAALRWFVIGGVAFIVGWTVA